MLARTPYRFARRSALRAAAVETGSGPLLLTDDAGLTWSEVTPPLRGPLPGQAVGISAAAPVTGGWAVGGVRNSIMLALEVSATAAPELGPRAPVGAPSPGAGPAVTVAPNPFNPRVEIRFALARCGPVQVDIYNARGAHVVRLLDGRRPAGEHRLVWDGRDGDRDPLPSGVYHARVQTPSVSGAVKLVLAR